MTLDELWLRFQREVKANGKKAALLAGLFLFGCCFWIPMLVKATTPPRQAVAVGPAANSAKSESLATSAPATTSEATPEQFWSNLNALLSADPMFRSTDVPTHDRNPFQMIEIPEPLPVLFADEPVAKTTPRIEDDFKGLELRSTIIGRSRRAALINGQLYQVGRQIEADGRSFLLTQIESNRVVLLSGEQKIELTLGRRQLKDVLNREGPVDSPLQ